MTENRMTWEPESRLEILPSGKPVMLPTGLVRVTWAPGKSILIVPPGEPHLRLFPGRDTLFAMSPS